MATHLQEHVLYQDYKWIAREGPTMPILELVDALIEIVEYDEPIHSVTQSSVWAVCMAYKHFRNAGVHLSHQDLLYTRSRGGVIGMDCSDLDNIKCFTIREYIESRDPGFWAFSNPHLQIQNPQAA